MMNISVYQINDERDENRIMFLSRDRIEKFQGTAEIDSKIYDKVYEKTVDCKDLEDVYTMLNLNHPEDYRGRSLSVSDIVGVTGHDTVADGFYFCDSFGFKKVDFEPDKCEKSLLLNETKNNLNDIIADATSRLGNEKDGNSKNIEREI